MSMPMLVHRALQTALVAGLVGLGATATFAVDDHGPATSGSPTSGSTMSGVARTAQHPVQADPASRSDAAVVPWSGAALVVAVAAGCSVRRAGRGARAGLSAPAQRPAQRRSTGRLPTQRDATPGS
jgi:hypothetical protein